MRKIVIALLLAVLQILCLTACSGKDGPAPTTAAPTKTTTAPTQQTTVPPETTQPPATMPPPVIYDHTTTEVYQVKKWYKNIQTAKMEGVTAEGKEFHIPTTEDRYKVMQGCCTDGKYMYAFLEKKNQDVDGETRSLCRVFKVDLETWEVLEMSEPLKVDHANGVTYNTKTNEIFVTHFNYNSYLISVVDPETLTVTRSFELEHPSRGLAYNAEMDQYAVLVYGKSDIVIYDADWKELAYYECAIPNLAKQCMSWDGKYLYMSYTGALDADTRGSEVIACYDWNGNFCGVFRLASYYELESTIHVNGETYMAFNNDGCKVFRLKMNMIELLEPQN